MTEHAVVIAGGGPTGLMLAGELALAGVDVAIVERRASQDLAGSRAGGCTHGRSRFSISAASPIDSCRRGRCIRSCTSTFGWGDPAMAQRLVSTPTWVFHGAKMISCLFRRAGKW